MEEELDDIADNNSIKANVGNIKRKLNNPNYKVSGVPKYTKNVNKVSVVKLNLPDEYKE